MYIYIMYKRTNKKHGNHPPTRLTTHSPADPPTHPPTQPPTQPPTHGQWQRCSRLQYQGEIVTASKAAISQKRETERERERRRWRWRVIEVTFSSE